MGPRNLPHTIRHYSGGGCATAFLGVFLVMILFSLSKFLEATAGLSPVVARGACAAVAVVSLLALYFFFSAETVATVDAEGMTVTSQSRVGPFRGRLDKVVDVRWAAVPVVYDATRSTITKHGNVQKSYRLTIAGQHFEGARLGTMNRDGNYLELIEAVRLAIGDRLVEKEDLGELDGAVRKLIAQESHKQRNQP
jgi:hypothetical protein